MKGEHLEHVGNVTLDLSHYSGKDRYNDGDAVENRLLEIVSKKEPTDYPKAIAEDGSWPVLYHLSPVRENILNWYPFISRSSVLELGSGCGAVTGALIEKGLHVTCVDLSYRRSKINATRHAKMRDGTLLIHVGANEEVLPELGLYDYVTLIGVLEYAAMFSSSKTPFHDLLNSIADVLKQDGRLLVAIENKLGLKYFAGAREDHTGRFFDGVENYPSKKGPYTFSKRELEHLAEECGYACKFYYPYPDYKFPIMIYSDDYLPRKGELSRNWQTNGNDRLALFDEQLAFDTIIDADLFSEFSNSFFVEMKRK